jgi:3-methyladenine DNA glycosylase Tag
MAIPERIERPALGDYLAVMSRAVFQAGLSWKMIESKWAAYLRLFEDFDVTRVAAFDEADAERIVVDRAIVRTRKKVDATIANARTLLMLDREYGGFDRYMASFADYDALAADLHTRFAFLGPVSVYYFVFLTGGRVPRFEDWEQTVRGNHPRMREMIAHARAQGWDG